MKTLIEIAPSLTIAAAGVCLGCAITLAVQRVKARRMARAAHESDAVWFNGEWFENEDIEYCGGTSDDVWMR